MLLPFPQAMAMCVFYPGWLFSCKFLYTVISESMTNPRAEKKGRERKEGGNFRARKRNTFLSRSKLIYRICVYIGFVCRLVFSFTFFFPFAKQANEF